MLTGDDGRICRDIPEEACREQPGNFIKHIASLTATKTGDGLADPKLVLSWLLGALGAPAYLIGMLVPIRESGALLPQLFIAGVIRSLPLRKWVWVVGSLIQGGAVLGMALAALTFTGSNAGIMLVSLLAVFALGRSICSVSYKDVLGKTVSKATRGTATGAAGSISAILILAFGASLSLGILDKSVSIVAAVLIIAGGLWIWAAFTFGTVVEVPGATGGGGNAFRMAMDHLALLREDQQLRRFLYTRSLMVATALAPPYLILLGGQAGGRQFGQLGPFVVASALAAVTSSFFWGRLADRSSRTVLTLAGVIAALSLGTATAFAIIKPELLAGTLILPALHFVLMIAHQGVRLGRSVHIVDMATPALRAPYTALSNTVIGVILLSGSVFGVIAHVAGRAAVLGIFAGMALGGALAARFLKEVQADDE